MGDQDSWNRQCESPASIVAANDRGRSTNPDMEIVRSLGDVFIARLLRRDQESDRALSNGACRGREPAARCDDHPRRDAPRRRQRMRVTQ